MRIEEAEAEYVIELTKKLVNNEVVYAITSNMEIVETKIIKIEIINLVDKERSVSIVIEYSDYHEIIGFFFTREEAVKEFNDKFGSKIKTLNNYIKEYEAL